MGVPYVGSAPSGPNDIVTKSYQDTAISTAVAAIPVPTKTTISYDAVAARGLAYEKVPLDWAKANGVKLLFGEVGIPSTLDGSKYNANYNNALRVWMERAKAANAPFQIWSGGEWPLDLRAYGPAGSATSGDLAQATNVASVLEPYLGYNTLNGVNLSGGEFGQNGQTLPTVPGVYGTDYQYPSANSIAYLGSRGIKTIRVPFRWERLQRTIGGALDTTESARFKAILDAAQANGMTVIADMHNYGGYTTATGQTAVLLGAAAPTNSNNITTMNDAFVDFWKKFAQAWGTHPGLNGYGLMNEPHDLITTGDKGGSIWRTASAAASEALYDITGLNKNIFVSGFFYATASDWVAQNGNTPWLYSFRDGYSLSTHPNVYFEAHMYFDDPDGGIYTVSYADNLTRATGAGFTSGTAQVQPEIADSKARSLLDTKASLAHTHTVLDITNMTGAARTFNQQPAISSMRSYLQLGSVDNTSDLNKPISNAQAAALLTKANIDAMPAMMRAFFALRQVTPVQIGWFGSSTIQGNNATAVEKRVVNILTGYMQRAYPNGITTDESSVQTFSSATKVTALGIHSYNAGIGGTGTANYLTDDMVTRATTTLGLNIRFHAATTNDLRNGVLPETSKTNLQSWITKLKAAQPGPAIDILIQSYAPWDGTYTYPPSEYTRIMREIAADPQNNGTVFFLDISDAYLPLGVPPTSTYGTDILDIIDTDNLHQNDKGHAYMAEVLRVRLNIPVENTAVVILASNETARAGTPPESLVFTRSAQ